MRHIWLGVLGALAVSACTGSAEQRPPEALEATLRTVEQGELVGFQHSPGAWAWRGVPFAAAPEGDLRWRAPRPAPAFNGRFEALDCGANPESWTEIFIQLWDVNEDRAHMPAGKFMKIIGKVIEHVGLDRGAKLTFEVSDGVQPMQLHRAALPRIEGGQVRVALSPRPASCKPRDRWLQDQKSCSAPAGAQPCCG